MSCESGIAIPITKLSAPQNAITPLTTDTIIGGTPADSTSKVNTCLIATAFGHISLRQLDDLRVSARKAINWYEIIRIMPSDRVKT
jgi:hypothetical protein